MSMKGHTEQSIHSHLLASHTHTHARTHTVKYLTLAYILVVADIATADTRLSCAAVTVTVELVRDGQGQGYHQA